MSSYTSTPTPTPAPVHGPTTTTRAPAGTTPCTQCIQRMHKRSDLLACNGAHRTGRPRCGPCTRRWREVDDDEGPCDILPTNFAAQALTLRDGLLSLESLSSRNPDRGALDESLRATATLLKAQLSEYLRAQEYVPTLPGGGNQAAREVLLVEEARRGNALLAEIAARLDVIEKRMEGNMRAGGDWI